MAELTLTGIAVKLEQEAGGMRVASRTRATQGLSALASLGRGAATAFEEARDLLCDYIAQEIEKPDELQALREAVRRAEEQLGKAFLPNLAELAQSILHRETGPHMGEKEG